MKNDEETPQLLKFYIIQRNREKKSQTLLPSTRMQRGAQESGIDSNDKKKGRKRLKQRVKANGQRQRQLVVKKIIRKKRKTFSPIFFVLS